MRMRNNEFVFNFKTVIYIYHDNRVKNENYLKSKGSEQTHTFTGHGIRSSQERSLFVQGVAVVGSQAGRDEDCVSAKEDWGSRID